MDLFNQPALTRGPSLQSFATYRKLEAEVEQDRSAVNSEGRLLEYETLALRLHPPNTQIDNTYPDRTVLIIDSANRPGTLVEVVQCLAELQLSVTKARISSDGGWFVDEFHVTEASGGPVVDERKLSAIRQVLAVCQSASPSSASAAPQAPDAQTVFQIAGPEQYGVLADIMHLLIHNGCDICNAAAWTHAGRAAAVLGVKERGHPIKDRAKLAALRKRLGELLSTTGDAAVTAEQVVGPVHHERRLHQLLLADAQRAWQQLTRLQKQESLPFPSSHLAALAAAAAAAGVEEEDDTTLGRRDQQQQQEWLRQERSPRTPAAVAAAWSAAWQKGHEEYVAALLQQRSGQQKQQQQQQQQGPRSSMAAAVAASDGKPAQQQQPQQQQQSGPPHGLDSEQQGSTAPTPGSAVTAGAAPAAPPIALAHSQSVPLLPLLPEAATQTSSVGMSISGGSSSPPGMATVLSMLTPVAEEIGAYSSDSAVNQLPADSREPLLPPTAAATAAAGLASQAAAQQQQAMPAKPGGVFASASGQQAAAVAAGEPGRAEVVVTGDPSRPSRSTTTTSSRSSSSSSRPPLHPVQGVQASGAMPTAGGGVQQLPLQDHPHLQQQQKQQAAGTLQPATTTAATSSSSGGGVDKGGSSRMPYLRVEIDAPTSNPAGAAADGGSIRSTLYSSKSLGSPRMVSAAAAAAAKVVGHQMGMGPRSPLLPAAPAAPQHLRQAAVLSPGKGHSGILSPQAGSAAASTHYQARSSARMGGPPARGGALAALPPRQPPYPLQQQQQQVVLMLGRSPKHSEPDVEVQHCPQRGYWLVSIAARDRNKLLFDTVCTMSDMRYDVYHGTVDSEGEVAQQLFYVRPRFGPSLWDEERAAQLRAMLEAAVQRRFPRGCKVHVFSAATSTTGSSSGGGGGRSSSTYLADLTAAFKKHQLSVTRCKVRAYGAPPSHTFYLLTASGALPSKAQVIQVCQAAGGELLEAPLLEGALLTGGAPGTAAVLRGLELRGHFGFYVRERRALAPAALGGEPGRSAWDGGRGQQQLGVGGSVRGGVERGGALSVPHAAAARGIACPSSRPGAAPSGASSFDSDGAVDSF